MTFIKPLPDSAPMIGNAITIPAPTPTWKHPMPTQPSIDLRDWFAGLAMQADVSRVGYYQTDEHRLRAAKTAYAMADAMIKAREDGL